MGIQQGQRGQRSIPTAFPAVVTHKKRSIRPLPAIIDQARQLLANGQYGSKVLKSCCHADQPTTCQVKTTFPRTWVTIFATSTMPQFGLLSQAVRSPESAALAHKQAGRHSLRYQCGVHGETFRKAFCVFVGSLCHLILQNCFRKSI